MSMLRSDTGAVMAILVGAAAGVAATVATMRALEPGPSGAAVRPGVESSVTIIHPLGQRESVVRWVPTPPRPAGDAAGAAGRTIILGSGADAPKVRAFTHELRIRPAVPVVDASRAELMEELARRARLDRERFEAGRERTGGERDSGRDGSGG